MHTMATTQSYDAISSLNADISDRPDEIEEVRRLPLDIAKQLANARLFNLVKPAELGGHQLPRREVMALRSSLSETNANVRWGVMAWATSTLASACVEGETARHIDGDPLDIFFGNNGPTGKLPTELPSSREAVTAQKGDLPYESINPLYAYGHGLSCGQAEEPQSEAAE